MNKSILIFLGMGIGGIVGFFAGRAYYSNKYKIIAEEEIKSVREVYRKKGLDQTAEEKSEIEEEVVVSIVEKEQYAKYMDKLGYKKPEATENRPHIIPPDEFGLADDYDAISLTYYADFVLADDDDRVIGKSEIEDLIGMDSLTRFGEYEEDSVYVRNADRKCDYEILLDQRSYSEVVDEKPYVR